MFLGLLDLGPAKYILKNASFSTDWLTPIVTSLAGEHAQCLSALLPHTGLLLIVTSERDNQNCRFGFSAHL